MQFPWPLFSAAFLARIVVARGAHTGPPVLQPFSFPSDLTPGEDATFRCVVRSGSAPYHFRWLKDGEDVASRTAERLTTTVVSERVATLNVRRVTVGDSGDYTCLVSDSTGADSAITASLGIPGNILFRHCTLT
ncbi:junctional adhesion molecule A-like [Dermacentor variabilis]|uniref:junctional adhesion molecule A-like n=1 Tax=Dermacentor variabilis TaxID=34621 RepID=UPI003F5B6A10